MEALTTHTDGTMDHSTLSLRKWKCVQDMLVPLLDKIGIHEWLGPETLVPIMMKSPAVWNLVFVFAPEMMKQDGSEMEKTKSRAV